MSSVNQSTCPACILRFKPLAIKWSKHTDIPPALVLAVIDQESGGNPNAKRYEPLFEKRYAKKCIDVAAKYHMTTSQAATSYGLMQLMFTTAVGYGAKRIEDLLYPDTAIRFGAAHLAQLYHSARGNIRAAAGAYNGAGANSKYAEDVAKLYKKYKTELERSGK